jgi:NitT/TauT family transport system ATP-binding protein
MDEPLGALDAQTRAVLQEELLQLWEESRKTVLYVTHSIDEAVFLGDRVVVMTAHPGTLKTVIDVDLPRPRDLSVMATPEFAALTGAVWDALRDEVRRAMAEQG